MTDDRGLLLERLAAVPARLAAAAEAAEIEEREVPVEGWPARLVVTHLAVVEDVVWHARLDQLATSPVPPRWSYTEPGVGDGPGDASLVELLDRFDRARQVTLDIVRALDDEGWRRWGVHERFGRLDVAGLLREVLVHDDEHVAELGRRSPLTVDDMDR